LDKLSYGDAFYFVLKVEKRVIRIHQISLDKDACLVSIFARACPRNQDPPRGLSVSRAIANSLSN
jgi:hypothetical protein